MKKLSFLLVLAFAFVISAQAQSIGVKAGYGMSGYTTNFYTPEGSKMGSGFNVGILAGMDLKVIALRADVTFVQLGSDFDSRDMTDADWPARAMGMEVDYKNDVNYLNIGVSAMKSLGPLYVGIGPYFGYALSNEKTQNVEVAGETTTTTYDVFDDPTLENPEGRGDLYNKTDVGGNLLIGAKFTGVFVEANVGYGFTNFINHDSDYYDIDNYSADKEGTAMTNDAKQNNLFFGLSIGYTFGF
jgi:hypothetical protein